MFKEPVLLGQEGLYHTDALPGMAARWTTLGVRGLRVYCLWFGVYGVLFKGLGIFEN